MDIEIQKYPIGRFIANDLLTDEMQEEYISVISAFPDKLKSETQHLTDLQLDIPYRVDGWTIRQVVHHCADSHMNCLTRFKLALTESNPVIKPYDEALWANLPDSLMPVSASLKMVESIHERWVFLLRSMNEAQFNRTFTHPETGKIIPLWLALGMYSWHCNHHLAHITTLKNAMHWK